MRMVRLSRNNLHIIILFDCDTWDSILFFCLYTFCYHALLCMRHKVRCNRIMTTLIIHIQNNHFSPSFTVSPKNNFRFYVDECLVRMKALVGSGLSCSRAFVVCPWKPFIENIPGCHYPVWPREYCYTERWGVSYWVDWTEEHFVAGEPPLNERVRDHFAIF